MSTSPTSDPSADAVQPCPACGHDLRTHDAISARFCQATAADGGDDHRRCICSTSGTASY